MVTAVASCAPLTAWRLDGRPVEAREVGDLCGRRRRLVLIPPGTSLSLEGTEGWFDHGVGYDGAGVSLALADGRTLLVVTDERVYDAVQAPSVARWACALLIVHEGHP